MSLDYSTATFSLKKTTLQRGNKFLTKLFAKYGKTFTPDANPYKQIPDGI